MRRWRGTFSLGNTLYTLQSPFRVNEGKAQRGGDTNHSSYLGRINYIHLSLYLLIMFFFSLDCMILWESQVPSKTLDTGFFIVNFCLHVHRFSVKCNSPQGFVSSQQAFSLFVVGDKQYSQYFRATQVRENLLLPSSLYMCYHGYSKFHHNSYTYFFFILQDNFSGSLLFSYTHTLSIATQTFD